MERTEETAQMTDDLVQKYPHKKWVIDAGALQKINPQLFDRNMIVTPHLQEFESLVVKSNVMLNVRGTTDHGDLQKQEVRIDVAQTVSQELNDVTILLKGQIDTVISGEKVELVEGGNAGMTKGGTGDVLAGLVAGLYAWTDDPFVAAVVASYINKKA